MQPLLFERPVLLLGVLAIVQFALTWHWARTRTPRARLAALLGLLLFPILLGVQAWVVTYRERITAVCRAMANAMEARDIPAVGAHVAPSFSAGGMDRAALLDALGRVLARVKIEEPRLSDFEVSTEGDRGRASFTASCRLVLPSAIESGMMSRWELVFQREGDGWKVVEIKPVPTPWFPYRSLEEILRASGG